VELLFYGSVVTLSIYSGYRCYRAAEKKKKALERRAERRELLAKLQKVRDKRKRYSMNRDRAGES